MNSDIQGDQSAKIIIRENRIVLFHRLQIYIDGNHVGSLKFINNFKTWTFQVLPGSHYVYVRIKSRKSEIIELDVKSGEKITLLSGFHVPTIVAALFGMRPFLRVKKNWLDSGSILVQKVVELGKTLPDHLVQERKGESVSVPIVVHFDSEYEKVRATIEDVNVPNGVTIKIRRSRTFEHTLEIEQSFLRERNIKVGFEEILGMSIRSEIEKRRGRGYRESETMEYEVTLNGAKNDHYKLIWTDIWQNGIAELREGDGTHVVPFRFREQTELHVTN